MADGADAFLGALYRDFVQVAITLVSAYGARLRTACHVHIRISGSILVLRVSGPVANLLHDRLVHSCILAVPGVEDWTVAPDETLFSAGLSCQNMLLGLSIFISSCEFCSQNPVSLHVDSLQVAVFNACS